MPIGKQKGRKTYSDAVTEALQYEFKDKLKHYLGLRREIEKWRE